mmetsp:Transcript_121602/g.344588  ORF Transcript_121602/g.344588 Transcript_121602/m.344588 type:complete len:85 (+) Transcript_121602:293-547(+)
MLRTFDPIPFQGSVEVSKTNSVMPSGYCIDAAAFKDLSRKVVLGAVKPNSLQRLSRSFRIVSTNALSAAAVLAFVLVWSLLTYK